MSFARFMATTTGRGIRIFVGIVLILWGGVIGAAGGYAMAAVGLVALLAGAFNVCLLAPFLKAPFSGRRLP